MAVTLKEVAERAGVSRSAVSRTFTDGASVSDKMRRKVEKAARELGYSPNALASSLTTGRTKLIGLVSNNFHNPIFLEVFDLFTRGLQDRGLRPLLVNLSDETDPENSVRMLRQYSVDGVVVASSTLPPGFAKAFRDAGVPVVHSFGRYSSAPQVHVVGIDNVECGRMAAQTLIARGYAHVAFMGGPEDATSTQDRFAGFMSEITKHPNIQTTHSFAEAYSFDAGRKEMLRLIDTSPAQAYFCGDDVLSIGALSAIEDSNLRVPEDIGIIGLNDMEMARWENIDLTTIHQPIRQIVTSSIELMVAMLDEPDRYPEARIFPCSIVERGTLRPAS
ncbi:LacI family transcriptional regulator [Aliiroseovarius crassostreae]|uniref:LacI family transcriptional regulator n=1 Tax=Aliiroseovarius crassostreae TaxID=154981 RepID=A0A9Q9LUD2_9RHOB|nr:LacI family DNA-binding transcriptional regulator [Aliiroseovarius crassostreae]UWP91542.1 LacI family transcriptional regulator [Aliiroseovarius crassostreae]UWP94696.1 LacI family transcriptional regulator [Aliiroseovarius crassostreae]UWP97854.1 LacI family transcriptional regulator [Aliiroseovarius crassostreae]